MASESICHKKTCFWQACKIRKNVFFFYNDSQVDYIKEALSYIFSDSKCLYKTMNISWNIMKFSYRMVLCARNVLHDLVCFYRMRPQEVQHEKREKNKFLKKTVSYENSRKFIWFEKYILKWRPCFVHTWAFLKNLFGITS